MWTMNSKARCEFRDDAKLQSSATPQALEDHNQGEAGTREGKTKKNKDGRNRQAEKGKRESKKQTRQNKGTTTNNKGQASTQGKDKKRIREKQRGQRARGEGGGP